MPSVKFRAAAVHAAPEYMNKAATTTKVLRLIEQASQQSITLLVFPEVFIPGFPVRFAAAPFLCSPPGAGFLYTTAADHAR